jgi:hypothetical protein
MRNLLSKVWWEAAGGRALRTAIVVTLPYLPAIYVGQIPYLVILSTAGLAAILSLLTSVVGLPEVDGKNPVWWFAIAERVVKTIAQAIVAGIGNAVLIQDVHWPNILQAALAAGFGSLLFAFLKDLPETTVPTAVTPVAPIPVIISGPVTTTSGAVSANVTYTSNPASATVPTDSAPAEIPTKETVLDEPAQ